MFANPLHLHLHLPVPGPAFGRYPERGGAQAAAWGPSASAAGSWLPAALSRRGITSQHRQPAYLARVRGAQAASPATGSATYSQHVLDLRADLGLQGLTDALMEQALGLVVSAAQNTLGLVLRDTQLLAARLLLDNRLAEMAAGEGKTHAVMLAAATAALAGVPVHVVTANAYLAERDASMLAPLYKALGLKVAATQAGDSEEQRREVWAADVAYTTAPDLIQDYLQDRQRPLGQAPLLRGLCMALIDDADSVLLDEARKPIILTEEVHDLPAQRRLRAALATARRLVAGPHFTLQDGLCRAQLTGAGRQQCHADVGPARDPVWRQDDQRFELIEQALAALHIYRPGVHLEVHASGVAVIDPTSRRVAPCRRWPEGLHQLIEMCQGLPPSNERRTRAHLSYQRFFPHYWRLAGTSGTLREARAELLQTYGLVVQALAPHRPCRRELSHWRLWADDQHRWATTARVVAAAHGIGRPVLVACDTAAEADQLCNLLAELGLRHHRVDGNPDTRQALCVARAGLHGAITVATAMAGRGIDIRLAVGVDQIGGLLVIDTQAQGSSRVDRQLQGRCGRGGQPGQVLRLQSLQATLFSQHLHPWTLSLLRGLSRLPLPGAGAEAGVALPGWLAAPALKLVQRRAQSQERLQRRELAAQDAVMNRQLGFGGRLE